MSVDFLSQKDAVVGTSLAALLSSSDAVERSVGLEGRELVVIQLRYLLKSRVQGIPAFSLGVLKPLPSDIANSAPVLPQLHLSSFAAPASAGGHLGVNNMLGGGSMLYHLLHLQGSEPKGTLTDAAHGLGGCAALQGGIPLNALRDHRPAPVGQFLISDNTMDNMLNELAADSNMIQPAPISYTEHHSADAYISERTMDNFLAALASSEDTLSLQSPGVGCPIDTANNAPANSDPSSPQQFPTAAPIIEESGTFVAHNEGTWSGIFGEATIMGILNDMEGGNQGVPTTEVHEKASFDAGASNGNTDHPRLLVGAVCEQEQPPSNLVSPDGHISLREAELGDAAENIKRRCEISAVIDSDSIIVAVQQFECPRTLNKRRRDIQSPPGNETEVITKQSRTVKSDASARPNIIRNRRKLRRMAPTLLGPISESYRFSNGAFVVTNCVR